MDDAVSRDESSGLSCACDDCVVLDDVSSLSDESGVSTVPDMLNIGGGGVVVWGGHVSWSLLSATFMCELWLNSSTSSGAWISSSFTQESCAGE